MEVSQLSTGSTTTRKNGQGLDSSKKKLIWDFIVETLEDIQEGRIGRKAAYTKFIKGFYKDTSSNANTHQKYFTQSLWRISLIPFSQGNSPPITRTLKFIYHVFSNCGTDEEKKEIGFTVQSHPMFLYILKLVNQSHMDSRQLVRLRIMESADIILEKHHKNPIITSHQTLPQQLQASFGIRLRDKYAPVRAISSKVLKYFCAEKCIAKDLKYYARFDPQADVRKTSLDSLSEEATMKASFFYEHAFDPCDSVRVEAFSILSKKSISHLSIEKRLKLLYWGLTRESRVKKCVTEKLIPTWFEECDADPITFLKKVGAANDSKVAFVILNNIYVNDFTETFDKIDLTFLNEEKIIPIEKLSLEAVIFWMFLIKKFGNLRFHIEKLLPNADAMGPFIRQIINGIHIEHEIAQNEERDEDVTLLECLTHVLTICMTIGLEEGNRRIFEHILKDILLDPILDEAPLIKAAVGLMKRIVEPHLFSEKMMAIFQEVFEPSDREQTPIRNSRHSSVTSAGLPSEARNSRNGENEEMELDNTLTGNRAVTPMAPPPPLELTEDQKTEIKDKMCQLAMQRFRLGEQKSNALTSSNYLEAHRLRELIDALIKEESELKNKIEPKRPQNVEGSATSRSKSLPFDAKSPGSGVSNRGRVSINGDISRIEDISTGIRSHHSRAVDEYEDEIPLSQANTTMTENRMPLSYQNLLKGFVMLTQFLSIHPKLTPFVRQLYVDHVTQCLVEIDPRIRQCSLHLLVMIGVIEEDERRKIMGILLMALESDTDLTVKCTAFKGIIDLLLKYKVEDFKFKGNGDRCFPDLFEEWNQSDVTNQRLEEMFIVSLDQFARGEMKTPEMIAVKVMGMIKLLQMSRIMNDAIISELICMWSAKPYAGSAVPYEIGTWLPTYTKLSITNARLVAKGLLRSLKEIITAHDDKENTLCDSDVSKVVDFVVPCISPAYLESEEGKYIHEEMALLIFNDILIHPKWTGNTALVKVTSKLYIQTEEKAREINQVISNIILKISSFPQTATVSSLKMALKAAGKRLRKQFEGIEELPEPNLFNNQSDVSDED